MAEIRLEPDVLPDNVALILCSWKKLHQKLIKMATTTRPNSKSTLPSFKTSPAQAPHRTRALWLCANCLRTSLVGFRPIRGSAHCAYCGSQDQCEEDITCPHPACGEEFQFEGQEKCPSCANILADAVPLRPVPQRARLLDLVFPRRREALRLKNDVAGAEFRALVESWRSESVGNNPPPGDDGTRHAQHQKRLLSQHRRLLETYGDDVERFLVGAPIRLTRFEGDYSWEFEAKRDVEITRLLDGILAGKPAEDRSLAFLTRCRDSYPESYSRAYLKEQLKQRFDEARSRPRPSFQLTLDYARRLSGSEFEHWVAQLLRDYGVPNVIETQASRDQGADVIVTFGTRKIVIQVKQYSDTVGNGAVQEAHAAKGFYDATEAWVVTTSVFTKDAVDLAGRLGVCLIPGTQLLELPRLLAVQINVLNRAVGAPGRAPGTPASPPADGSTVALENSLPTDVTSAPIIMADEAATGKLNAPAGMGGSHLVGKRWRWVAGAITAACVIVAGITTRGIYENARRVRDEQSIQLLLNRYQAAIRSKNIDLVGEYYAPVVETYYRWHDVPRAEVLKEIRRAFAAYQSVAQFNVRNMAFRELREDRATATFDKEWYFRGVKNFAGEERQEMTFVKLRDEWRIASEKELKVYWVRHSR
jgi:restriction endonuclease